MRTECEFSLCSNLISLCMMIFASQNNICAPAGIFLFSKRSRYEINVMIHDNSMLLCYLADEHASISVAFQIYLAAGSLFSP